MRAPLQGSCKDLVRLCLAPLQLQCLWHPAPKGVGSSRNICSAEGKGSLACLGADFSGRRRARSDVDTCRDGYLILSFYSLLAKQSSVY